MCNEGAIAHYEQSNTSKSLRNNAVQMIIDMTVTDINRVTSQSLTMKMLTTCNATECNSYLLL